jgi:hypothetical protein
LISDGRFVFVELFVSSFSDVAAAFLHLQSKTLRTSRDQLPQASRHLLCIRHNFAADFIINMDETSWKQINSGPITLAEKRSETVNCFFDCAPKMCLVAIAAIDAAGGKLPFWVLGRGTTTKCERKFRKAECF